MVFVHLHLCNLGTGWKGKIQVQSRSDSQGNSYCTLLGCNENYFGLLLLSWSPASKL